MKAKSRIIVSACLLASLVVLLAVPSRGLRADEIVPIAEVSEWLKGAQDYLTKQSNPPSFDEKGLTNKGDSTFWAMVRLSHDVHFDPKVRAAKLQEARDSGLTEQQFYSIASTIPTRVAHVITDFYEANLAPLRASVTSIEGRGLQVKRGDFDKLKAALEDLKKYAPTLQKLRTDEWGLQEKQLEVIRKALGVHSLAESITKGSGLRGADQPNQSGGANPQKAAYHAAVEKATKPLPDLYKEWKALDKQDEDLARTYVRKVFTFEIPPPYDGSNKVTPLIDGETVFARVDELLNDVAASAKGKGYVHISLWECDINTMLTNDETFYKAISKVRADGDEVAIALWGTGTLAKAAGIFGDTTKKNEQCKAVLEQLGARVRLIEHPDITGSNHEKTFIFFNGTELRAIVGGLNLAPAERGAAPHSGAGWHDVAVEIKGPATDGVEADFIVRWYAWARAAEADRVQGPSPTVPSGDDEVRIALTRPELSYTSFDNFDVEQPAYTSIHDELVKRIDTAQSFIYLENYAIFEESLVRALGQRIAQRRSRGQPFDVIILVSLEPEPRVYNWLHFITYQHLSFMACNGFTYVGSDPASTGGRVDRSRNGAIWRVGPYEGDFYENTKVYWDGGSTDLKNIIGFDGDVPLYTKIRQPAGGSRQWPVFIHSKVAIFDDEYAAIGSANFNPRSMYTDGELTAFIHGAAVTEFRKKLWIEHLFDYANAVGGAPFPTEWKSAAKAAAVWMSQHPNDEGTYTIPVRVVRGWSVTGDAIGDFIAAFEQKKPFSNAKHY